MAYYENIIIDQSGRTKCELCNTYISESSIELHLNDKNHNRLFVTRIMIQNSFTVTGSHGYCGICEHTTDLSKVLDHIQSNNHKKAMDSVRQIIEKDGVFLILPEKVNDNGSKVNCLICDRSVGFNFREIKNHITSERHRRARSIAVQPLNAIFSVEDSNDDLWCKICQVYFENYIETIFEHVDEDQKHVTEIEKLTLLIKDQNISIQKFFENPKEDKAMCNKCSIEVPCNFDNLSTHIMGKKHKSGK